MNAPGQNDHNFWLQARIDGSERPLEGGPRSTGGGLEIRLFQRREGEVARALDVLCSVTPAGLLQVHLDFHLRTVPEVRSCTILTRR